MRHYLLQSIHWFVIWLYYVCLICLTGATIGVLTHLLWAMCFVDAFDLGYYASLGFLHGFQYAGVWAGGASIVLCVIRARKEWLQRQSVPTNISKEVA